ncbi:response regulator transcription factor [Amycolatopsis sp. cg5]|uniref:helix-turn-helix transcriptional regulator n=1 Tax=Amycolatopsis sp. cg5 TaxID=3238802 RepID=UPI003523E1C9
MDAVNVLIHAADELSEAGVKAMLSEYEKLRVVPDSPDTRPDVLVVVVAGVVGTAAYAFLRRFHTSGPAPEPRAVLVADRFKAEDLLMAVECGVAALLPRSGLKAGTLAAAVTAVSRGAALIPYHLQGVLLEQIGQLRTRVLAPAGLTLAGVETRERDVLSLIAEGYQTEEIASLLTYSEGTVKNVLYGMMARLRLHSRAHAVAYALREGVI